MSFIYIQWKVYRHNREAIVNFEPNSDCQNTIIRRPMRATDNTFQQDVDIYTPDIG
jgi:hypothetical protein